MNIYESNKINGVSDALYYGQYARTDDLNERITSRQFPDMRLRPNFDMRPVPTKYSHFPIIDRRTPATSNINHYLDYSVEVNFNPGNGRAPPAGYMNNVDKEMQLRNQFFALQKSGDKGTYIPSAESDLYSSTIVSIKGDYEKMGGTHTLLFEKPTLDVTMHPNVVNSAIGKDRFFNHTRTQLRGI